MSNDDPSREESILRSLRRILRAVALHGRQLQRDHQLTAPQLLCLRFLRDSAEAPTAGEVARALALSGGTVTGILDRLERRGLLERRRGERDRRRVRVELTEEGRRVAWEAPLPLHEKFARRLSLLPDNASRRIDEVLQDVVQLMEADELEAAPVLADEPVMNAGADAEEPSVPTPVESPPEHAPD